MTSQHWLASPEQLRLPRKLINISEKFTLRNPLRNIARKCEERFPRSMHQTIKKKDSQEI
jgi:hypothetical protein